MNKKNKIKDNSYVNDVVDKLEKAGKKLAAPAADVAVDVIQQVAVKQVKKVAPAAGIAVKKAVPIAGKVVKKAIVGH